jgi:hypothetical protein
MLLTRLRAGVLQNITSESVSDPETVAELSSIIDARWGGAYSPTFAANSSEWGLTIATSCRFLPPAPVPTHTLFPTAPTCSGRSWTCTLNAWRSVWSPALRPPRMWDHTCECPPQNACSMLKGLGGGVVLVGGGTSSHRGLATTWACQVAEERVCAVDVGNLLPTPRAGQGS